MKNYNTPLPPLIGGTITVALLFTLCALLPSCDNAQAEPYREMYEKQIVVSDSLRSKIDLLEERMELVYDISIRKIDSLKNIIDQKDVLIVQQDSIITNASRDFQVFLDSLEYDLEHLSDQALENLINIQKR
jgi:hypothetical protein